MLQIIAIAAGAAVAGVLGIAATRSNVFRVQRAATISAPPDTVYPLIADFRRWADWSPWEKLEPGMTRSYGGADSGTGATYAWEGQKVGAGRMEITETDAPARIDIDLHFLKPWEAHNKTVFALDPTGGGTLVTWTMEGPATFMTKVMGVVMNMEKRVGKDFDAGLASMKRIAEGTAEVGGASVH